MNRFTVHSLETAPAGSRPLLEGLHKAFGFVPNLYAVLAESPAALKGALAIGEAFSRSTLSPAEQQLVALAVSEANDCRFCVAAHSTLAKHAAKADPAAVAAARAREPLADPKLDALVIFTRKVVEQRGWVAEGDVATFLEAGYTRAQVIEVLLGVGMKTFNNYVDHIAHVPLNDQFKAEAWQPKRKVA
ncbi:carboxymuconolactone decarboxylase [Sulfurifustis variabilis]|uniref:Carboxymuconolactone decarboxylase n=1 Tax=Sulfurifustis variabilis TaxID=1675686 RepID=A0A1B4V759_9GAMM|nr:carboxymuconolactone decarboxylase family protein [Sulfurifustis variabilis]BAU49379.1 carboxymuconolactone decarboxylase [Sulfurifustis variabilis]